MCNNCCKLLYKTLFQKILHFLQGECSFVKKKIFTTIIKAIKTIYTSLYAIPDELIVWYGFVVFKTLFGNGKRIWIIQLKLIEF